MRFSDRKWKFRFETKIFDCKWKFRLETGNFTTKLVILGQNENFQVFGTERGIFGSGLEISARNGKYQLRTGNSGLEEKILSKKRLRSN